MKIFLLTHERELKRVSNTGSIALKYAPHIVERIIWQRVSPNKHLTSLIERNQALLLYQSKAADITSGGTAQLSTVGSTVMDPGTVTSELKAPQFEVPRATVTETEANSRNASFALIESFEYIIVIDSTWQESRKIYNKSPYLKSAPCVSINTGHASAYRLRRNQVPGGLCTIECIIEVLTIKRQHDLALELSIEYRRFNQQ